MFVGGCMGLGGSACSECVPELTCHFRPPEHVPRVSAGPRTPGGIPVCQGAESTRKDPRPREKKMTKGEKTYRARFPFGVCWKQKRKLKTDTQVPQQKPQLICVGWNTFTEAARKGFPPNIINIGFEHLSVFICSFRLWGVFGVEESVELTCQSYEMIAVNVSLILKLTAQA